MRPASTVPGSQSRLPDAGRPLVIVRVHARWVIPVAAPVLRGGWIDVDPARGEIVGRRRAGRDAVPSRAPTTSSTCRTPSILPGLVNAHTHLELSHLAGAVAPADSFVSWVRAMLGVRFGSSASVADRHRRRRPRDWPDGGDGHRRRRRHRQHRRCRAAAGGLVAVGRALPRGARVQARRRRARGVGNEAGRHARADASRRAGLHAARRIGGAARAVLDVGAADPVTRGWHACRRRIGCRRAGVRGVIDPPGRIARGGGVPRDRDRPVPRLLADLGAWDDTWVPPGLAPVPYLQQLGALHARLLVVHGTQLGAGNSGRWPTPARPSCCAPGATAGSARACLPSPRPSPRACGWRSAPTVSPVSRT